MQEEIQILEEYDGFRIIIGEKTWKFDQEDSIARLVDVFRELGHNAVYEELY